MFKLKYIILAISFLVISETQSCLGWLTRCFKRQPVGITLFEPAIERDYSNRDASAGSGVFRLKDRQSLADREIYDHPEDLDPDKLTTSSERSRGK